MVAGSGQGGLAGPPASQIATLADRLVAPVAVVAPDSTVLYVNPAAARSIGQEPAWLLGRRMLDLVHPEDRPRIRRQLRKVASARPSGGFARYRVRANPTKEWRVFDSSADNLLDDPNVNGILISSRDVTEQFAYERALQEVAYLDVLTGLPNRARITEQLAALVASETPVAVAFVGIDRFGLINDSLGYTAADAVLKAVGERVRAVLPSDAVVGRFGGDLLVLVIPKLASTELRFLLWGVVQRLGEPLFIAGHELRLSASAGVTERDNSSTVESLLGDADLALHHAKRAGGGRVEFFNAEFRGAAVGRLQLEADLRRALAHSELSLAIQPIVRLDTGEAARSEALLRWHRGQESISPCTFVPVAEETGLVVPLGDWVIDKAVQLAANAPGGQLSVNLSARQLGSPGLVERISRVLAMRQLPASALCFEITETLVIENFDYAVSVLQAIRQLGCRVGMDDFGSGYSSLGYLRRLPLDFLKIDRSLIADVDSDPQARAIVGAIITMADALGLETIAEGVESEAQAEALRHLGCTMAQGFLFGLPVESR